MVARDLGQTVDFASSQFTQVIRIIMKMRSTLIMVVIVIRMMRMVMMIIKFIKFVITMRTTCLCEALWLEPCPVLWLRLVVSVRCDQLREDLVHVSIVNW